MTASLLLGQASTILCGFQVVRAFGKIRRRVLHDTIFDERWEEEWQVVSDHYAKHNVSALKTYRFLHLLAPETEHKTISGVQHQFRILAVIDHGVITGKWMDPEPNGYYGAFQLLLSHTRDAAIGRWTGFASNGTVKSGVWTWRRTDVARSH